MAFVAGRIPPAGHHGRLYPERDVSSRFTGGKVGCVCWMCMITALQAKLIARILMPASLHWKHHFAQWLLRARHAGLRTPFLMHDLWITLAATCVCCLLHIRLSLLACQSASLAMLLLHGLRFRIVCLRLSQCSLWTLHVSLDCTTSGWRRRAACRPAVMQAQASPPGCFHGGFFGSNTGGHLAFRTAPCL